MIGISALSFMMHYMRSAIYSVLDWQSIGFYMANTHVYYLDILQENYCYRETETSGKDISYLVTNFK